MVRSLGQLRSFGIALLVLTFATSASAVTIDFDDLSNGEVVTDQYVGLGVTISAINPMRPFDLAIGFDSTSPSLEDPDLTLPWVGGNDMNAELGRLLVVSENSDGGTGTVAIPDDEGQGPGSTLIFEFATPITSVGFHLIDIEGEFVDPLNQEDGVVRFFVDGAEVFMLTFGQLATRDGSISFGDRTANWIVPISLDEDPAEQGEPWDEIRIELGGSGAVDNLTFTPVPEPETLVMMISGLLGLALAGQRRLRA